MPSVQSKMRSSKTRSMALVCATWIRAHTHHNFFIPLEARELIDSSSLQHYNLIGSQMHNNNIWEHLYILLIFLRSFCDDLYSVTSQGSQNAEYFPREILQKEPVFGWAVQTLAVG